jgi:hypothetical protein
VAPDACGKSQLRATEAHLAAAFQVLQKYDPKSQSEQVFYQEAVTHLNDVASQRRARTTMARQELPPLLQALAFGGALVLIPLTFLYGMRKLRVQMEPGSRRRKGPSAERRISARPLNAACGTGCSMPPNGR